MVERNTGIVYLIGAGPGDPGLITVRGKKLLESCSVVVYDNLIPGELIVSLPDSIEKIYVGKESAHHSLPQAKINELLADLARQGKTVARLKGSDPLIFGRGGEEARHLKKNGLRFEIVPGVTAGIAAGTYSGIPCTDREVASMVSFVTGHKATDKSVSSVPWDKVAGTEGATLVIYMGVGEVENIARRLLSGGMPPTRPAAIVERGTFGTQRVFTTDLAHLAEKVIAEVVRPPAVFIIGEVVDYRQEMAWLESRPLHGIRIMITRPVDQALELYETLRNLGAEILPCPTIATRRADDTAGWDKFGKIDNTERWLIFTSENGTRYFFEQFYERFGDIRKIAGFKIAAVGTGTKRALKRYGLIPDMIPDRATTAGLTEKLIKGHDIAGAAVVRIRGNLADRRMETALAAAGAEVIALNIYETYHPVWPVGMKEKLLAYPPDIVVFTSGSTAGGLRRVLSPEETAGLLAGAVTISIGPMTTEVAGRNDIPINLEATEHNIEGIINKIIEYCRHNNRGQ